MEHWKKHVIEFKDNKWFVKFKSGKLKDHKFTNEAELKKYLDWLKNATYA
jgi:hypothetical protein